jgi:hypothetical protein
MTLPDFDAGPERQSTSYWRQALEIFDQLGDAQADEIRARLDGGKADPTVRR